MDCSPQGSTVHGISQARILEWVAISFSRGPSLPRDWTHSSWHIPCIVGRFFTTELLEKPMSKLYRCIPYMVIDSHVGFNPHPTIYTLYDQGHIMEPPKPLCPSSCVRSSFNTTYHLVLQLGLYDSIHIGFYINVWHIKERQFKLTILLIVMAFCIVEKSELILSFVLG